jgi:quinol monooxygenase YgiN
MIFVAGYMMLDPAHVDAFEQAANALADGVRKEDGCIHYSLLIEDRAQGRINVLEMWRDEAALRVHLALPQIVEFANRFVPHISGGTAQLYDAVNPRPLDH